MRSHVSGDVRCRDELTSGHAAAFLVTSVSADPQGASGGALAFADITETMAGARLAVTLPSRLVIPSAQRKE